MRTLLLAMLVILIAAARPASAETLELRYTASLLNVLTLGEAGLRMQTTPGRYAAVATVRTAGAAAMFDDTRISASASGALAGADISWTRYELSHDYARKSRRVAMRRSASGVHTQVTPAWRDMGTPPASAAQQAASFDPVSALVALSRAVGRGGCAARVSVFDGRQHYTLALSPKAQGRYRGGGYTGPAMICALRYIPVSGFKPMTAAERARIPVGEIWFGEAQNGVAPPLRIEAPTPFGAPLRVDLASLRVAP